MLKGDKPLAVFTEPVIGHGDGDTGDGQDFDRHVRAGALLFHEAVETWEDASGIDCPTIRGRRTRLYAVPDEAWRISAYLLLQRVSARSPWNDSLERLQGALLGYTEQQTEEWLRRHYERHAGWGCFTLYAATTGRVIEAIMELGGRAFPRDFLAKAKIFSAGATPTRAQLEADGLVAAGRLCRLVRFGVAKRYFESLKRSDRQHVSLYDTSEAGDGKELNRGLLTEIQVVS
jgi:hypothetical protein